MAGSAGEVVELSGKSRSSSSLAPSLLAEQRPELKSSAAAAGSLGGGGGGGGGSGWGLPGWGDGDEEEEKAGSSAAQPAVQRQPAAARFTSRPVESKDESWDRHLDAARQKKVKSKPVAQPAGSANIFQSAHEAKVKAQTVSGSYRRGGPSA
jgi:hypothetical protein